MFALAVWRRPIDQVVETVVYGALALVVAVTALLHHHHPPPLTVGSAVPWLAVLGAILALAGALVKGTALLRARRFVP